MNLMIQSMILIIADSYEKNPEYIKSAKENFNYLLGKNTLDKCFVTGFGTRTVIDPHHRPTIADSVAEPVPGMVAGGPNMNLQDNAVREQIGIEAAVAKVYLDIAGSYSTNEITTYWNSPALFVAAYFD